jgi:hypothetical protein
MTKVEPGIDKKTLFKELGYEPHSDAQWEAHLCENRYRIPCCGRRWGKTTFAAREMTHALFTPDSYFWIVGPKYSTGEKEFRIVYNDLEKLGFKKYIKTRYNVEQGNMWIQLPWGTRLEVKSAERKDGLLGEGLRGVIMSEAARHDRDTWEQYVMPALNDYHGWAIFPSTPTGYNWYYGLWQLGQEGINRDYRSWRFPSWTNPVVYPGGRLDPEILQMETTQSHTFFLQEIAAEFTAIQGSIYEEWNEGIHVKDFAYNPAWANYWAFDYGFAAPFVCLDIMVDPHDNVYVWRDYQVSGKTTGQHSQILRSRDNPEGFHVDGAYGDPHGANESATLAQSLIGVHSHDVAWDVGIEYVKRWLKIQPDGKPKLFVHPSCTELRRQMQMLRKPPEREGKPLSTKPQWDYDDHGPDALRYFFGQHFFLGAQTHLTDLYSPGYVGSEAQSFFTHHGQITKPHEIIPKL